MSAHGSALLGGKRGIVTGAGRGIGRAVAMLAAEEGASVLVADIDIETANDTAEAVRASGGTAIAFALDVSDDAQVQGMVRAAVDGLGGLDFAHNNAATHSPVAPFAEHTIEDWQRIISINLTSVFSCLKHEILAMLSTGGGSIVNTSSTAGLVGVPGMPAYVASKHGVAGLTKVAALDYATQGIRVNAVCPGWVATPMVEMALGGNSDAHASAIASEPVARLADPREIAEAVVWLCSDRASFTTGSVMTVDGGYTTW